MIKSDNKLTKIIVDGYSNYFKRIDSTHVQSALEPDFIRYAIWHIAQLKHQPYYNDLELWLHDKKDIDGNEYTSDWK